MPHHWVYLPMCLPTWTVSEAWFTWSKTHHMPERVLPYIPAPSPGIGLRLTGRSESNFKVYSPTWPGSYADTETVYTPADISYKNERESQLDLRSN